MFSGFSASICDDLIHLIIFLRDNSHDTDTHPPFIKQSIARNSFRATTALQRIQTTAHTLKRHKKGSKYKKSVKISVYTIQQINIINFEHFEGMKFKVIYISLCDVSEIIV